MGRLSCLNASKIKIFCVVFLVGILIFFQLFHHDLTALNYNRVKKSICEVQEVIVSSDHCPPIPPNLQGEFEVDFQEESLDVVNTRLSFALKPGGWYTPKECKPRDRVAIVVPMRGRERMIPTFLKNIHPMLMRQQIETNDQEFFNKGAMFNIGYKQALKMYNWDCFIFHDIDLIPFNDHHLYKCPRTGPMHMGVAIDHFKYK